MRLITIKSSIELAKEQKSRLENGINAAIKEEARFRYLLEEIVGGIIVMDGETVIDASLSAELYKIKKNYDSIIYEEKDKVPAKEIPALLKERGLNISDTVNVDVCGYVISAADGVAYIDGLSNCRYGELLQIGKKGYALAMNLEKDSVGAIILSDAESVVYGDLAFKAGKIMEIPVGRKLLGRVINPLGEALDGKSAIRTRFSRRLEFEAPRIIDRAQVSQPLKTGVLAIDAMVPIGKGQRELIIGDRQTGKTSIALDAIINQKGKDVICIYVAIGQRASAVGKLVQTLEKKGAMSYTCVVMSTAADSAPLQYLAPYAGAAISEYFMYKGKDVLIVYDDLSRHAVAYRTISLLLKRPAGREAFPGDIFYNHSKLLERAAKLSDSKGGGSVTALPIVETQAGDISSYIPTNVISITDGQIYLEKELFNAGQRPAVNVGLSVSRVGGSAQSKIMRRLSAQLRLDIAHYRELAVFSQFGSSIDSVTGGILSRGERMVAALCQPEQKPMDEVKETLYLYAMVNGFIDKIEIKKVRDFLNDYSAYVTLSSPDIADSIIKKGDLDADEFEKLKEITLRFAHSYGKNGREE